MSKAIFSIIFLICGILIGNLLPRANQSNRTGEDGLYLAQCGADRFNGKVEKKSGKFYTPDGDHVWLPFKECSIVKLDSQKLSVVQPE